MRKLLFYIHLGGFFVLINPFSPQAKILGWYILNKDHIDHNVVPKLLG
jgi:hypothetical protein